MKISSINALGIVISFEIVQLLHLFGKIWCILEPKFRTKLVIECRKNVNMHHIQEKGLVQLIISAHHILHIFF